MRWKMIKSAERADFQRHVRTSLRKMWVDLSLWNPLIEHANSSKLEEQNKREFDALRRGETNVAALSRRALIGSNLWESASRMVDEIFCDKLCRFPLSMGDTQGNNERLIKWIINPTFTSGRLAAELASSEEAQWCAYRRSVEAISGLKPEESEEIGREGCFIPRESYLPPDHDQEKLCAPVFEAVRGAVALNTSRLRELDLFRTRDGKSWGEAEDYIRDMHVQLLGRVPDVGTIKNHLSEMLAWRRSDVTVNNVVRLFLS